MYQHKSNPELGTIKPEWKGTPQTKKGRFVNHEFPFVQNFKNVWKWKSGEAPQKEEKQNDNRRLALHDPSSFLASSEDGILWLGHACFFIRIGGNNILIDPVFNKLPFVKQYIEIPNPLPDIEKLDYLLISHDHRDHCDKKTIRSIGKKFPNIQVFTGLGLDQILQKWLPNTADILPFGWYQRKEISDVFKLDYLPTRHWGRRGLFDINRQLWGAFMIRLHGTNIYFGGDSGYGSHYKELPTLYDKIDYFLVGSGAYSPRWFMHSSHTAPEEAIQAFIDSGAQTMIPMHYGKYDLSDEPPGEPLALLKEISEEKNVSKKILTLAVGEPFLLYD